MVCAAGLARGNNTKIGCSSRSAQFAAALSRAPHVTRSFCTAGGACGRPSRGVGLSSLRRTAGQRQPEANELGCSSAPPAACWHAACTPAVPPAACHGPRHPAACSTSHAPGARFTRTPRPRRWAAVQQAHLSNAARSGGACAMTAMLRGRGCRMPVAAFTAYCCSAASSAAAAADARLRWLPLACPFCSSAWLRLPLRLCAPTAPASFCSSTWLRLLLRLCPADARPCCTTGSSGGSSGCLASCRGGGRGAPARGGQPGQGQGHSKHTTGLPSWQPPANAPRAGRKRLPARGQVRPRHAQRASEPPPSAQGSAAQRGRV